MDKERLMQFLSDAIDMGIEIDVRSIGNDMTKEQAKALAERFSDIVGSEVKDCFGEYHDWYKVRSASRINGSFFHNESMKKPVSVE